jgi:septal ring factor EnvC (AmiA/AmiB activator)
MIVFKKNTPLEQWKHRVNYSRAVHLQELADRPESEKLREQIDELEAEIRMIDCKIADLDERRGEISQEIADLEKEQERARLKEDEEADDYEPILQVRLRIVPGD